MTKWKDIPVVKLGQLLEKKSWFNGSFRFSNELTEEQWENRTNVLPVIEEPRSIFITIPYKYTKVSFHVFYSNRGTFDIRYRQEIYTRKIRARTAKSYTEAIRKIESAVAILVPMMEKRSEIEEKQVTKIKRRKGIREKLQEEWGCKISGGSKYRQRDEEMWTYSVTEDFEIKFMMKDDKETENPLLVIYDVRGYFTSQDMKRFIEVMATSTTTVAARLGGNKGIG